MLKKKLSILWSKATKMGCIDGHNIDYNGIGVLRGQRHYPAKIDSSNPPPWGVNSDLKQLTTWTSERPTGSENTSTAVTAHV